MSVTTAEADTQLAKNSRRRGPGACLHPRYFLLLGLLQLIHLPAMAEVNPEVGPNDFQVSFTDSAGLGVEVGYSSNRQEYLASWIDDFYQDIVVQRLDGLGVPIGDPIVTGLGSNIGQVVVSHDPVNDRFLVVASLGSAIAGVLVDSTGLVGDPFPITGPTTTSFDVTFNVDLEEYVICRTQSINIMLRRVTATGDVIGLEDVLLTSSSGVPYPSITYNPVQQEYLVAANYFNPFENMYQVDVWLVDPNLIFTIRTTISTTNDLLGNTDVEYNPVANEYLVVWIWGGDTETDGKEVYGQLVDSLGQEIGPDDFKISTMGRPGRNEADAFSPRIRFNSRRDRYLVVWHGDDFTGDMVNDEYEIFGQYVSRHGGLLLPGNFRLSDFGPTGDPDYSVRFASSAYNGDQDEFLVLFTSIVWVGPYPRNVLGQRVHGAPTIFSDGFEVGDTSLWSSP